MIIITLNPIAIGADIRNEREPSNCIDALAGQTLPKYGNQKLGASQKKSPIPLQSIKAEAKLMLTEKYKNKMRTNYPRFLICVNNASDLRYQGRMRYY